MVKHRKKSDATSAVHVDGHAAHSTKKRFYSSKWTLVVAFVVVFGGLGSAFVFASHADAFNCQAAVLSGNHILRCAQPCPTGTHGNKASDNFYYCFGQATTALSNCQAAVVDNIPAHRCNFGCPVPTTGTMAGAYFYCFGTPAGVTTPTPTPVPVTKPVTTPTPTPTPSSSSGTPVAKNSCQAATLNGAAVQRCSSVCPTGTHGNKAGAFYYCSLPTTSSPSSTPTSTVPAAYSGGNDGCGGDAVHYFIANIGQANIKYIHVNSSYKGSNNYCFCTANKKIFAYTKYYSDAQHNAACSDPSTSSVAASDANSPASGDTSCNSVSQRTPTTNGYYCHGNLFCSGGFTAKDGSGAHGQAYTCQPSSSPKSGTPPPTSVNGSTSNNRNQKGRQV